MAHREEPMTDTADDDAPRRARRMLDIHQVLDIVPLGRTTIYRMELEGRFPASRWPSPGRRTWYEDEIIEWQEAVPENSRIGRRIGYRKAPRKLNRLE